MDRDRIELLHDWVLIQPLPDEQQSTEGGIIAPTMRIGVQRGIVVESGPGTVNGGAFLANSTKRGDLVHYCVPAPNTTNPSLGSGFIPMRVGRTGTGKLTILLIGHEADVVFVERRQAVTWNSEKRAWEEPTREEAPEGVTVQ